MQGPATHHPPRWRRLTAACFGALLALGLTTPWPAAADEADRGGVEAPHQLSGSFANKQFVAGTEVFVDAQVDDDVFAAGADVELRDARVVDVFALGALVTLEAVTATDAILAGGKVDLRGDLSGDMIAAGGVVELGHGSTVAGDVLAAGGRVALAGDVDGEIRVAAGHVRIDGAVGGTVRIAAETVVLGPNAAISGDLIYRSEERLRRMEGAQVAGQIERRAFVAPELPGIVGVIAAGAVGWIGVVLSGVALAALLIGAVPRLMAGASDRIAMQPWPSFGIGVLLLIGVPVAAVILLATLVGIPIGLIALLLYLVLVAVGLIATALWIGQHLPQLGGRHAGHVGFGARFGRASAGVVLLALVALVPILGGLAILAAVAFGLGASAMRAWELLGGRNAAA
jgi:cytoskeletal protein CcmA (bactofilin family)